MNILVCGGRVYGMKFDKEGWLIPDKKAINKFNSEINKIVENEDNIIIISGHAKGADTLAIDWARANGCEWKGFPANWKKYGKAAGPIRNQQMLDEGKPNLVVAFPGGKGTANMIMIAKAAKIPVIIIK